MSKYGGNPAIPTKEGENRVMEKKKLDLGAVAIGAGKNAKAFLGKAKDAVVKAADQNDDGSLDLKDAAVLAEAIGNSAKNAVAAAKEGANAIAQERERQRLRPIFPADIMSPEFRFSKLIRLTEPDKRRRANELCQGSIGFMDEQKGLRIVNLYRDRLEAFGLTFLPNMNCDFYYVDPSDETAYIALDEYFAYLKKVRVDELQMVAQSLGAKHFRVTYQEEKATFSGYKVKAKGDAKGALGKVNAGATHDLEAKDVVSVAVAAEMECPGHAPVRPKLRYLREEPCIQNLVSLRLGENSPTHLHYRLKLSNSSGLKISDAVQIDAALKAMKMTGNSTVTSEAQNESRRLFEYEIDF